MGPRRHLIRSFGSVRGAQSSDSFALTFDDGPNPSNTPAILQVLADRGVHATFFMIATNAAANPALVASVLANGHEVGLHSRTHRDLTMVSVPRLWIEIHGGKQLLEGVTGEPVRLFRPPYGTQNLRSFLAARLAGLEVVLWSASPRDFLALALDQHRDLARRELGPGGILLLHDGPPAEPRARIQLLKSLLDDAARSGLHPTTVSDLLAAGVVKEPCFVTRVPAMVAELVPLYRHAEANEELTT